MTITITLPQMLTSADLRRLLRALWPLAAVALPAVAEAVGASFVVRLAVEIAVRVAGQAMSA
ncbi:hypothetical protein DQ384_04555 [Sphaerisporangium album]|uniref:Uncharacterized protein n=1 Tax=Sphaerisporangium album TaxID=509200 RepID=A0A367FR56_9ACTN|nr:hypothetical protein [Sphaerisporangium album]RCG32751.1 hypothetical protein DQ384_04555 [Sphaerisporangium album]